MNDDGGMVEKHRRDPSRILPEIVVSTRHELIKEQPRSWLDTMEAFRIAYRPDQDVALVCCWNYHRACGNADSPQVPLALLLAIALCDEIGRASAPVVMLHGYR